MRRGLRHGLPWWRGQKAHQNVLVLDAGDINTGRPESNLFKGEPDILGYNAIGYDAFSLGNHEFDNGLKCSWNRPAGHALPLRQCLSKTRAMAQALHDQGDEGLSRCRFGADDIGTGKGGQEVLFLTRLS